MDEFRKKPTPWTTLPTRPTLATKPVEPTESGAASPTPAMRPHLKPSQAQPQGSTSGSIKIIPPERPALAAEHPIFTSAPAEAAKQPDDEQITASQNTKPATSKLRGKRHVSKPALFGGIAFILIVAAVASFFLFWPLSAPKHFSADLKQSVSFPLYYPVNPPLGYSVDQKSLANQTTSGLIYIVLRNGSKTINVSEQANPNNSYIITIYQRNLTASSTVSTPIGTATMGTFSGRIAASLLTDKTWIIVSASQDVPSDSLTATLRGLQLDK